MEISYIFNNKYARTEFTDDEKLQYLQQAISRIPELCSVKATTETLYRITKQMLTYNAYFDLLCSQAQAYDLENKRPILDPFVILSGMFIHTILLQMILMTLTTMILTLL